METESNAEFEVWAVGYNANRHVWNLQGIPPNIRGVFDSKPDNTWICDECGSFVMDGHLCPCQKGNNDDFIYRVSNNLP